MENKEKIISEGKERENCAVAAEEKKEAIAKLLDEIYDAMTERGYDPINQFVAYILSDDPANITSYQNARSRIRSFDRDELLHAFVEKYFAEKK